MHLSSRWLRIIGLLLLVFLLWRVDLATLWRNVRHLSLFLFGSAILLNIPQIFFKAVRWQRLLRSQQIDYPLKSTLLSYCGSIFIGLLTPGRLGEFIKALHVSNDCNVPKARAFSTVLIDRLFDLGMLLFLGAAALIAQSSNRTDVVIEFLISALLLAAPAAIVFSPRLYAPFRKLENKFGRIGKKVLGEGGWIVTLQRSLAEIDRSTLILSVVFTLTAYTLFFVQCYLLALSIQLPAGFLDISYAVALGSLVTLLPISVSGLGTREAAIVAYFGKLGVSSEAALGFSLLVFATFYVAGGLMGAIAWLIKPVNWKSEAKGFRS